MLKLLVNGLRALLNKKQGSTFCNLFYDIFFFQPLIMRQLTRCAMILDSISWSDGGPFSSWKYTELENVRGYKTPQQPIWAN